MTPVPPALSNKRAFELLINIWVSPHMDECGSGVTPDLPTSFFGKVVLCEKVRLARSKNAPLCIASVVTNTCDACLPHRSKNELWTFMHLVGTNANAASLGGFMKQYIYE